MAWNDLKTAVAAVIKTNGTQSITGALLQSTLNSIIDQVGADATFKGVATPSTVPGTPDGPVFYLAVEKGVYSNFGGQSVSDSDGFVVLLYSSVWNKYNIPMATKTELAQLGVDLSERVIAQTYEINGQIIDGVITSNSYLYQLNYLPVNKGDVFQVLGESTTARTVRVAFTTSPPSLGMSVEIIADSIASKNINLITKAPDDGYMIFYMYNSWINYSIYKLSRDLDLKKESFFIEEETIRKNTNGYPINANPFSPDFGKTSYVPTTYSNTDFIDIADCKYILPKINAESTTVNIIDKGLVFYDTDKQPLHGVPISHMPQASMLKYPIVVPDNSKYVRFTIYDSTSTLLKYKKIEKVIDKIRYNDVTDLVGGWFAGGTTAVGENIVVVNNEIDPHLAEITINTPASGQRICFDVAKLLPLKRYKLYIKYSNTSLTGSPGFVLNKLYTTDNFIGVGLPTFLPNVSDNIIEGEFIIPEGNWNYLHLPSSSFAAGSVLTIKEFSIQEVVENVGVIDRTPFKKIKTPFTVGKIVDVRPSSPTFGEIINATNNDWAATDAISLEGATHIEANLKISSGSANYAGITGYVFYDKDLEPIIEGSYLLILAAAREIWKIIEVPKGAEYFRHSVYPRASAENYYDITLYKKKDEAIKFLIDNGVSSIDDEKPILQQLRFVNNTKLLTGNLTLLHFSDIHADNVAAAKIRRYFDEYGEYIDDMVSTGDITSYLYSDGFDFYINNKLTDALFSLGNHDGATADGPNKEGSADWNGIGNVGSYNAFYKPYIDGWGVIQPPNAEVDGLCYYYKDYPVAGVRLISIDAVNHFNNDYLNNQIQWFQDRLDDLLDPLNTAYGYSLVVISHYIPGNYVENDIITNESGVKTTFHTHVAKSIVSDPRFTLDQAYPLAVESFISNGGKFVIWLSGHYHTDYFYRPTLYPNILASSITQAGNNMQYPDRSPNQEYRVGSYDNHVANLVTVDTTNGVIKLKRIGCNIDKYMRPINILTYDYKNKKVVTNY